MNSDEHMLKNEHFEGTYFLVFLLIFFVSIPISVTIY